MTLLNKEIIKKLEKYIKKHHIPEPKEMLCAAEMISCENACFEKNDDKKAAADTERPKISFNKKTFAKASEASAQRQLSDVLEQLGMTFSQCLFRHIDEKGLSNADVYKKAGIDRKLFSKIQCSPDYKPAKKTAIALALALELNLDEAKDLISRAGYAFSPSSVFDLIIQFFIENEIYDIYIINEALYQYNEPVLL